MKLSQLKTVYNFCEENSINFRSVVSEMIEENIDFEVDGYRFILESEIDQIQVDELEGDPYLLGCFTDWFIADNTDLSYDIVKVLQKSGEYQAIGQHIIDNGLTEDLQAEYARLDGYGHHFASYDSHTMEGLLDLGYYVFRVN